MGLFFVVNITWGNHFMDGQDHSTGDVILSDDIINKIIKIKFCESRCRWQCDRKLEQQQLKYFYCCIDTAHEKIRKLVPLVVEPDSTIDDIQFDYNACQAECITDGSLYLKLVDGCIRHCISLILKLES